MELVRTLRNIESLHRRSPTHLLLISPLSSDRDRARHRARCHRFLQLVTQDTWEFQLPGSGTLSLRWQPGFTNFTEDTGLFWTATLLDTEQVALLTKSQMEVLRQQADSEHLGLQKTPPFTYLLVTPEMLQSF